MTVELGRLSPHAPPASVSPWSRVYGLGSVYAKTLRDSRRAVLIMSGLLAVAVFSAAAQYGQAYNTPQSRTGFVDLVHQFPGVLAGIYGTPSPAHLSTLGGMVSLKDAAAVAIIFGVWSILALSSTLATEARRGSLEFVVASPLGARRVAIQKVAAHLTGVFVVVVVLTVMALLSGGFGTLPGDAISFQSAAGFGLWAGLMGLASGSLAFALSAFVGRGAAAGLAGFVMLAGYLLHGYEVAVPALSGWANLTWFGWTDRNQPLAGQYDWASLLPVALFAAVLLAAGVEAFARRDLGSARVIGWLRFPDATLGLRGPLTRSLGERLPIALAWGAGVGIFALGLGASGGSINTSLAKTSPASLRTFRALFPKIDLTQAGGFLQLAFVELGLVLVGFAAVNLLAGWASDESSGRFEMLLTAPIARMRWALSTGLGLIVAILILSALIALGVGIGAAATGSDAATPMLGTIVLALYAAAAAGVGMAVGGLVRSSVAAGTVAVLVTLTFLVDTFAPALRLPDWVHELALTAHLGLPMVGIWDWGGVAACVLLAAGGLIVGAWGLSRRDVGT